MKMKFKRGIRAVFLAVMFITLTCAGGFADTDVGITYTLGGFIAVGGGWLSDQPRHMDRTYLKEYLPFPQGFLADTELKLESKEGLDYYGYRMSHPGLTDQDYFFEAGKLGVYHAQIEYDELQHLYCTVNPYEKNIGILVQRLRFSGWYSPTPEFTLFAEDDFIKRTGSQPSSYPTGPTNPYNFTTYIRPIHYNQNDLRAGAEYGQPTDQPSIFTGRVSYHLSTFENGLADLLDPAAANVTPSNRISLPPSNMANYVTAEGGLDLKSYYKTRISGSMSYGWLSQNDYVFAGSTSAGPPASVAGQYFGTAGLGATTFAANIAGITHPIDPLTLKLSYRAYDFENNNTSNVILQTLEQNPTYNALLKAEQYSYFRQGVNFCADYRVNNLLAFTAGYIWSGVSRTEAQGRTSSNSPQFGMRLSPNDWLTLMANYTYTTRTGINSKSAFLEPGEPTPFLIPLTYKFYAGSLNGNKANFIAEVDPANNVTCSFNFSIYTDNYTDSIFGLQSDRGWSAGADLSWRPHERIALSLGYDHQQMQVEQRNATFTVDTSSAVVGGDSGTILTTSDSYDTFIAKADVKLIPNKLDLTTNASFSFALSNFNNDIYMPHLNEYYANISTFLTYKFNEHWAVRAGYLFQAFGLSNAYHRLYSQGVLATGGPGVSQIYNTMDGYYRNATANVVQGFLQYKF